MFDTVKELHATFHGVWSANTVDRTIIYTSHDCKNCRSWALCSNGEYAITFTVGRVRTYPPLLVLTAANKLFNN